MPLFLSSSLSEKGRWVKDKYPILVVEELLDELHGTVVFLKLDP